VAVLITILRYRSIQREGMGRLRPRSSCGQLQAKPKRLCFL